MIALLDNTVISNFSFVQRPDLVFAALGSDAATVQEAFAEYAQGVRLGRVPACDWSWLAVLELTDEEEVLWVRLASELGTGEAACIACAVTRGLRVFTDDRDAPRSAVQMHVPISGTLGLLLRLIDLEVLSLRDADALLVQMIARGYRAPVNSLAELR